MAEVAEGKNYTFRLRAGKHCDRSTGRIMKPGDTVTTEVNLRRRDGRDRWELVGEGEESIESLKARIKILEGFAKPEVPEEPVDDGLENKSIRELREVAKEMEPPVDLTGVTGKDDIIAAIRQAQDNA